MSQSINLYKQINAQISETGYIITQYDQLSSLSLRQQRIYCQGPQAAGEEKYCQRVSMTCMAATDPLPPSVFYIVDGNLNSAHQNIHTGSHADCPQSCVAFSDLAGGKQLLVIAALSNYLSLSPKQLPRYKNFNGTIHELGQNQYLVSGEVSVIDRNTIEITELPVRTWTQVLLSLPFHLQVNCSPYEELEYVIMVTGYNEMKMVVVHVGSNAL